MRLQKTTKLLIILMTMLCLVLPSAEAKKKDKRHKEHHRKERRSDRGDRGSKGDRSFMINAGAGLGLILPGFDVYTEQWGSKWDPDYDQWTYINFGGYIVGNFGLTFDMGKKKKWSLGPAIQLGWKAQAGPFAGFAQKRGDDIDVKSADEMYSDYYISNRARFQHAFIADACIAIKGNPSKSARFVAEGGLRFSVAFMYDYVEWGNSVADAIIKDPNGWSKDFKYRFMLGPSLFFGGDAYIGDHIMITPGFRFAAAFGPDWGVGGAHLEKHYDSFGTPIATPVFHDYSYTHVYIDLAFEMKINWYTRP